MSSGSRSRRVDSTWPNLTKIGPSASRASRSLFARGSFLLKKTRKTFPERRGTNSCKPKRSPTLKMRASLASLDKAADPLFQALDAVAQPGSRAG